MPFPPTPSQTPSNTPTPSITPSNTPSYTPTGTVCPGLTPTATSTIAVTPTITPTPTQTQTSTQGLTPTPTTTPTTTPTPSSTEPSVECIQLIDTVIAPVPQTGINNFFGVNIALDPYPVTENVTVTGYISDDSNPSNRYDFSITIIGGTESGETANNVLMTGPAETATIFVTGVTPTTVTYNGNSVYICGFEPPPIEYYYYSIRRYDCTNNCAVISPDLIGRSSIQLSTTSGTYYKVPNSGFGSVVFQVQTEITPAPFGFDVDMDNTSATGADCSSVCNA
jgi:hypothetical protein